MNKKVIYCGRLRARRASTGYYIVERRTRRHYRSYVGLISRFHMRGVKGWRIAATVSFINRNKYRTLTEALVSLDKAGG